LFAFVVLGLVSSLLCRGIGWEERLRNDLFCVKWDVKPQLNQSVNQSVPYVMCRLTEMPITWWKLSSRRKLSLRSSSKMNVDHTSLSSLDRRSR